MGRKKKMGRPRNKNRPSVPEQVEELASIGCTLTEIAAVIGVSDHSTVARTYAHEISKGQEKGKERLRRLQWKSAQKGNVTMQIWLGKQLLGQIDKPEIPITVMGEKQTITIAGQKIVF